MAKLNKVTCMHGAGLYDQTGEGDWFHSEKCVAGCLPMPFDPRHFENDAYIEDVGDGSYVEWFSCGHKGECDNYIREVSGPEVCRNCGFGFMDIEDLKPPPNYPVSLWEHEKCPGGKYNAGLKKEVS